MEFSVSASESQHFWDYLSEPGAVNKNNQQILDKLRAIYKTWDEPPWFYSLSFQHAKVLATRFVSHILFHDDNLRTIWSEKQRIILMKIALMADVLQSFASEKDVSLYLNNIPMLPSDRERRDAFNWLYSNSNQDQVSKSCRTILDSFKTQTDVEEYTQTVVCIAKYFNVDDSYVEHIRRARNEKEWFDEFIKMWDKFDDFKFKAATH